MSVSYKYCIVPMCKNTTVKTPEKVFIILPEDKIRRKKWLKACRRNENDLSLSSKGLFVCEDHFNLEEDMAKYMKFKLMGGQKKMKPHVVPHIFNYQPDRKRAFIQPPRVAAAKRVKRQILADAIALPLSCDEGTLKHTEPLPEVSEGAVTEETTICTSASSGIRKKDASIQNHIKVRSKSLQCNIRCGVTVGLSPLKINTVNMATTPTNPLPSTSSIRVCSGVPESLSGSNESDRGSDYTNCSFSVSDQSEEFQFSCYEKKR